MVDTKAVGEFTGFIQESSVGGIHLGAAVLLQQGVRMHPQAGLLRTWWLDSKGEYQVKSSQVDGVSFD